MKRILVTGGAGFIGTNLCQRLLDDGHHVICLDNFYSSEPGKIAHLRSHKNFTFIDHDIIQSVSLEGELDEIYHLACPASPKFYQKDPIYTTMINVVGGFNLLELAREKGARILLTSTSEVYGNPEVAEQSESYHGNVNCTGPRACYDEGKRTAESVFFDHKRKYDTNIKVVRIFNTYGPYLEPDDGRVIPNFINQALNGDDITIYGDGSQTRSFCYIDDMVDGLIAMMASNESGPINLGNPNELTIKELALLLLSLIPSTSKLIFKDLPIDDPLIRKPNISKAYDQLGWKPKVDMIQGLNKTISYFSNKSAQTDISPIQQAISA